MPLNNDMRRLWRDAGLSDKSGSAAVCLPPAAETSRVYYLTSAEYAISNIVLSRLKVGRFSQLNDPFELLAPINAQTHNLEDVRQYRENFDNLYGLLCFSSDWTDPVLWSHYGARHQGICLGFNVPTAILRDVRYQSERLEINASSGINAQVADMILCTKFESWKYEKERRMLVPLSTAKNEGPLYFASFDDELALAEVILGPLCSLDVHDIRAVVNRAHSNVTTFKARLAYKSFNVVAEERSVLRLIAPVAAGAPAKKRRKKYREFLR